MTDTPKNPEETLAASPTDVQREDALTSHNYDGIQEYDNPIPGWWKWIFIGTILFTPLYLVWFHAPGMGRDHFGRYDVAMAENLRLQFGDLPDLEPDAPTLVKYMHEEDWLKVGASTFAAQCRSCHGPDGSGGTGPNLTDDLYINVERIEDFGTVLKEGANNGAMPAWENRLHPKELVLVAAYAASLRGQNLPSSYGGDPGKPIDPWPEQPADAEVSDAP